MPRGAPGRDCLAAIPNTDAPPRPALTDDCDDVDPLALELHLDVPDRGLLHVRPAGELKQALVPVGNVLEEVAPLDFDTGLGTIANFTRLLLAHRPSLASVSDPPHQRDAVLMPKLPGG